MSGASTQKGRCGQRGHRSWERVTRSSSALEVVNSGRGARAAAGKRRADRSPGGCVLSSGRLFCSLVVLLPVLVGASGQQGVRAKSQRWHERSGPSEGPPRPHPWPVGPRSRLGSVCHVTSSLWCSLSDRAVDLVPWRALPVPPPPCQAQAAMSLLSVSQDLLTLHISLNGLVQRVAAVTGFFHGQRVLSATMWGVPFLTGFVYPPSLGPGAGFHLLI